MNDTECFSFDVEVNHEELMRIGQPALVIAIARLVNAAGLDKPDAIEVRRQPPWKPSVPSTPDESLCVHGVHLTDHCASCEGARTKLGRP